LNHEREASNAAEGAVEAPVEARLKWFNGPKGFGFVVPDGREDVDAFLHITTLQKCGVQALGDEARLLCHIQYGPKGAHVTAVVQVLDGGVAGLGGAIETAAPGGELGKTCTMDGTVKWYKPDKGFGFVVPDDGLKDVFIHKSCLRRYGIETLTPGMRVKMTFRSVPKGREVIHLDVISE
jgi:CspA family cold shock protein